jgi:chromosome segregation ATPase
MYYEGLIQKLDEANLALDDELKALKHEYNGLLEQVRVSDDEIKELKNKIEELKATHRFYRNKDQRQRKTIEDLRAKLLERDEKIDRLEGQISHLTLKIERMITKAEGPK